jgi:flavodoxin
MKKALVIYDSKFGNTEKIAKALAAGMQEQGIAAECAKVEEIDIDKLTEYDLLAVGGPTHGRTASKPMRALLEKFDRGNVTGKKAFAFDTKFAFPFAGSAG